MHQKAEQNITQMFNQVVLLQTLQSLKQYEEFCYQLYLFLLYCSPDSKTTWSHQWAEDNNVINAPHALYSVSVSSDTQPFIRTYYDALARDVEF